MLKALYGSPEKMLKIGNVKVECYVLENQKRVLSGRGMQKAIGFGEQKTTSGNKLRRFIEQESIQAYVPTKLREAIQNPVEFIRPGRGGMPAHAFEGELLIDLCDTIIQAYNSGSLLPKDESFLRQAQIITTAFAKQGITDAIDEITGYQYFREKDAIQKNLNRLLAPYANKWIKRYPDDFWVKLLAVYGYPNYKKRPSFIGHLINDIIYDRLAPEITRKLQELNPRTDKGYRKHKHHQYLTQEDGVPELHDHIVKVMALMDASMSYEQFIRLLNKALPKYGDTRCLPFDDSDDDK
ncbi:MAG: P63C domain-containing protein [Alphaproteobacteria bacterium GM202ARS2]|nr:P63C domain-containing protein [Alphaproteobacteria bacterium GM202ARS2]